MRPHSGFVFAVILMTAAHATAMAQGLFDAIKDEVEKQAKRAVAREAVEQVSCVFTDQACIEEAKKNGADVTITDSQGNVLGGDANAAQTASSSVQPAAAARAAPDGSKVGTVEMVVNGQRRTFDVRQGPSDGGFAAGYNVNVRGEREVVSASLHGFAPDSDEELTMSVAFWRQNGEHMCDPFSNQLSYRRTERRSLDLRPGGRPSESCPPPAGGHGGGLSTHINLDEASYDEASGTVRVAGSFAGPLGRDGALAASEGRFEAELTQKNYDYRN